MLNDSQQRKALVLSLLMVMLAQTAYIEAYRGWTLADQPNPSLLNAGCNDVTRTSGTPIYVDNACLLYTSPSPRDLSTSRMPSSA